MFRAEGSDSDCFVSTPTAPGSTRNFSGTVSRRASPDLHKRVWCRVHKYCILQTETLLGVKGGTISH